MIAIAIDDEPKSSVILHHLCDSTETVQLARVFHNPLQAIPYLLEHKTDLIFLDIQMPQLDGFAFLKRIEEPPLVIFTTAYDQYALDSYMYQAVDYLLKPIDKERFHKAVDRAHRLWTSKSNHSITIKDGTNLINIKYSDIYVVNSLGNYLRFHTKEGTWTSRMTFDELQSKLPKNLQQCHRSYFVNIDRVEKAKGNFLHIAEHKIPVSRTYKTKIRNAILENG